MSINPAIIILGVAILIAICLPLAWYNKLVRLRQLIRESWGNVDVQLKRRYDLIPNLVSTVKGYAAHEQQTSCPWVPIPNHTDANRPKRRDQQDRRSDEEHEPQ